MLSNGANKMKKLFLVLVVALFISSVAVFPQNNDTHLAQGETPSEQKMLNEIIQRMAQAMRVVPINMLDANNSASGSMVGDSVFTGTATNLLKDFGGVQTISIFGIADQASATNGLKIYWSTNGTTMQDSTMYSISANTAFNYLLEPKAQYYKITYTNGATPATSVVLKSMLQSAVKVFGLPSGASSSANQDSIKARVIELMAYYNSMLAKQDSIKQRIIDQDAYFTITQNKLDSIRASGRGGKYGGEYTDTTNVSLGDSVTFTSATEWVFMTIATDDTIYVSKVSSAYPVGNKGVLLPGESLTVELDPTAIPKYYYKQYGTGTANVRIFWNGR